MWMRECGWGCIGCGLTPIEGGKARALRRVQLYYHDVLTGLVPYALRENELLNIKRAGVSGGGKKSGILAGCTVR